MIISNLLFNPLLPSAAYLRRSAKILILIDDSYERRDVLRVGRRREFILCYVPKNYEKKNSGSKGLRPS